MSTFSQKDYWNNPQFHLVQSCVVSAAMCNWFVRTDGPRIVGDLVQFVTIQPPTTNWPTQDGLIRVTRLPSIVHVDDLYTQVVWLNVSPRFLTLQYMEKKKKH